MYTRNVILSYSPIRNEMCTYANTFYIHKIVKFLGMFVLIWLLFPKLILNTVVKFNNIDFCVKLWMVGDCVIKQSLWFHTRTSQYQSQSHQSYSYSVPRLWKGLNLGNSWIFTMISFLWYSLFVCFFYLREINIPQKWYSIPGRNPHTSWLLTNGRKALINI